MKRQFVLLSLSLSSPLSRPPPHSLIPSFRDTYVVFPYSEEVSSLSSPLLLFLSSVSLVTAFGHIRQPILAEGHDFAHLPPSWSRLAQVSKFLPGQFYCRQIYALHLPSHRTLLVKSNVSVYAHSLDRAACGVARKKTRVGIRTMRVPPARRLSSHTARAALS